MQDLLLDTFHSISIDNGHAIEITSDEYSSIRYLTYPREGRDYYCNLLASKCKLDPRVCRDIVNIIAGSDSALIAFQYIQNRSVSIEDLVASGNLYNTFNFLDRDLLRQLYHYRYHSQPNIGSGELLICTLIQNAEKSNSKGDCIINGKEIEVKCDGGRLVSQKGYGDGHAVIRYWHDIIKSYGAKPISDSSTDWNWIKETKNRKGWYFYHKACELIQSGQMSVSSLRRYLKEGLLQTYLDIKLSELSWIDEHVSADTIDKSSIRRKLTSTLIKYYIATENLYDGGILVMSREGKCGMCTLENSNDYWNHGLKISSYPNWSKKAGPQGKTVAIAV